MVVVSGSGGCVIITWRSFDAMLLLLLSAPSVILILSFVSGAACCVRAASTTPSVPLLLEAKASTTLVVSEGVAVHVGEEINKGLLLLFVRECCW